MKYQGFISYSHAADGKLAPALQQALHNLARPWYSFRLIHVFRDQTSLSANPALWASIEAALSESEYFLLMASPEAAHSKWVQQEVRWWLTNRPADKLLIVLTDGDAQWDETTDDFDWTRTTALPNALRGTFKEEPLYVDLRWAKNQDHLSLRHSQFRAAVLDIAAPLHGKPKDELDGEDVRLYRSAQRLKRIAIGTFATLFIIVVTVGLWAFLEQKIATSRERAVSALSQLKNDSILSVGITIEAINAWQTPEAVSALRQALQESSYERVELPHNDKAPVVSAQYSADGTRLLTAGQHGEIHLWDPATPLQPVTSFTHRGVLSAAVLSRDARYILTAAGDRTGVAEGEDRYTQQQSSTVYVWDTTVRTAGPVASLKQVGNVYAADMSPNGRIAVIAGIDCTARLWAWTEKDREPIVLQDGSCRPRKTINDTPAAIRHGDSDCHPSRDPHWGGWGSRQGVFAVAFSPNGQLVATGGGDCLVHVWDVATGQLRSVLAGHTAEVTRLVFSPDGSYLVSASGLQGGGDDSVPWIWDVGTWQGHALLGWRGKYRIFGVAVSPDSQFVAVTYGDDVVRVWNAKTREPWAKLLGHEHWVTSAAFNPVDSHMLVTTGGADATARVWDIGPNPDQSHELFILHGHKGAIGTAVFSPTKGDQIVTTGVDGTAQLWDLNLGVPLGKLPDDVATMHRVTTVSPDKGLTLTLDDRIVRVHDNVNNRDLPPLRWHIQRVVSAAFSPDSRLIVTAGGDDNTACIWDAITHDEPLATLRGHWASVLSAEFDRTDKTDTFVVTAGNDGTARMWDVATGQNLATFVGRGEPFAGASFNLDNKSKSIVTWGDGGRFAKRYRCDVCGSVDDLLAIAKQRVARRPLTVAERKRFLHEGSNRWILHW